MLSKLNCTLTYFIFMWDLEDARLRRCIFVINLDLGLDLEILGYATKRGTKFQSPQIYRFAHSLIKDDSVYAFYRAEGERGRESD